MIQNRRNSIAEAGIELWADSTGNQQVDDLGAPKCAPMADHPELAAVVNAWPRMTSAQRKAVLAIVRD